jgi:formyltetrahydrofolate-dependent phosphoribosylglycinamide formyltransferase
MPTSPPPPLPIAVLISGGGTTLTNLLEHIRAGQLAAEVKLVIASRDCAGVEKAEAAGIETAVRRPREYATIADFSAAVFARCARARVQLVVLGGFLSRIEIPAEFAGRVMNIHPALIPAFCGHGMYGHHVHEAVLARGAKVSGCTVHFCDNEYDHGPIILQRCVPVLDDDTPDALAARVFAAECEAYPEAIGLFAAGRLRIEGSRVQVLNANN